MERELPKGWKFCNLKDIGKIISGGTPSTTESSYWGSDIAWITPADLSGYTAKQISKGRKSISNEGLRNSSARILPKGSVLFSSRAPIGYVAIASNDLATNQGFKSIVPNKDIDSNYLYYYLKHNKRLAEDSASGTTFKEISGSKFSELPFVYPIISEQQQIVEKIEELFSELDKGIENMKTAQQQLKVYRQAVLKWAFEGKLTNENVKDGELPEGWEWKRVSSIGKVETGSTPSKQNPAFYSMGYPFYKPTDLEAGYNVRKASDNLSELGIKQARFLPANSILVTCIGATIGKTGIIREPGASNQQINAIILSENYNPNFIYYQVISSDFQNAIKNNASATTLPIINKSKFQSLEMVVCSKDEQSRIVQEIESRLSVCDKMEETISTSLQQAEALRQSILKMAFEGKLVKERIEYV